MIQLFDKEVNPEVSGDLMMKFFGKIVKDIICG